MEDPKKFRIKSFRLVSEYVIEIYFEDGKKQTIDFGTAFKPGWMEELKNPDYFKQVTLNEAKNLCWPNGQDYMPEHLYYWEKFSKYYNF